MLFAAIDFVQYRWGKGRYRNDRLQERGWRSAVVENFSGSAEPAPVEALLFHPRHSLVSWLIMYISNNAASHVGLYVGDGDVYHSTTAGVLRQPLSRFLDGQSLIKVRSLPVVMTEEEQARTRTVMTGLSGLRYNWRSTIRQGLGHLVGRENPGYLLSFGRDTSPVNWRLYTDVLTTFGIAGLTLFPPYAVGVAALGYVLVLGVNLTRAARLVREAQYPMPSVGWMLGGHYAAFLMLSQEGGDTGQAEQSTEPAPAEGLWGLLVLLADGHWALSAREPHPGDAPVAHRIAACLLLAAGKLAGQARASVEACALGMLREGEAPPPPALDELVRTVDSVDGVQFATVLELLQPARTERVALLAKIYADIAHHLASNPNLAEPYARRAREGEALLHAAVGDGEPDSPSTPR
ncbi:hypothetical protein O1Q96_00500 (plasmid) [Streptomyces sp. Qhu-G9]|uniref:hypothetical protein n=1 Tax=Streptomyces sp. Qhu-G9 TaxID=3452799 RepID=UPI0022AC3E41|nr:hypothetical protein [Streptomyces aurantiacus]WAU78364.1 hypothetical protein O1Q96_00500 [Streptomyces aurantiacus]